MIECKLPRPRRPKKIHKPEWLRPLIPLPEEAAPKTVARKSVILFAPFREDAAFIQKFGDDEVPIKPLRERLIDSVASRADAENLMIELSVTLGDWDGLLKEIAKHHLDASSPGLKVRIRIGWSRVP